LATKARPLIAKAGPLVAKARPLVAKARPLVAKAGPVVNRGRSALAQAPVGVRVAVGGVALLLITGVVAGGLALVSTDNTDGSALALRPAGAVPALAVTEYRDRRGFTVNVPKGWTRRQSNSSYVDFVDPADADRRIRLNVERSGDRPADFAVVGETYLKSRASVCAAPYRRVALRETTLAGRPAAELEYTCGDGGTMRHGIWRIAVVDANAYHFYLTTDDSTFRASRAIYDEMVRSYRFRR
jgi:hypothetical protein